MIRTDVVTPGRPRRARTRGMSRGSRVAPITLLTLLGLLLAGFLLSPAATPAASTTTTNSEGLSGYGTTTSTTPTTPPTTTPTTTPTTPATTPSTGATGTKESTPAQETKPSKESTSPSPSPTPSPTSTTTSSAPAHRGPLPFTGLDLRWVLAFGLVMVLAGGLWMLALERRGRSHGRARR